MAGSPSNEWISWYSRNKCIEANSALVSDLSEHAQPYRMEAVIVSTFNLVQYAMAKRHILGFQDPKVTT